MDRPINEFAGALSEKLKTFDKQGAALLCQELISRLYQTNDLLPPKDAERILQNLRNKRLFALMQQVGDALIQTGRSTFKLIRLYAQSLIDQGNLTAAIAVLNNLVAETEHVTLEAAASAENKEAKGLLGRVYKQLYINAKSPENKLIQQHLQQAIRSYFEVYTISSDIYLWHGINAVACLCRAHRDGIVFTDFPDPKILAKEILTTIKEKDADTKADMWDFATAAEACIALERPQDALPWIERYVRAEYADAFEIASTLRQFTEVWSLDMTSETGKLVLPILKAELLKREGGEFTIDLNDLKQQEKGEKRIAATYEKVFGNESFSSYEWYTDGVDRCLTVARLGKNSRQGEGSGFLLKGNDLNPQLGEKFVLLTNAHVLSNDENVSTALRPDDACIIFEALDPKKQFKVGKILWTSPPSKLDTTIVEFTPEDSEKLRRLIKKVKPYPVVTALPLVRDMKRIYIIGHPNGGTLCLSLQDNLLLDYEAPLIHYRTPTVGGSSGSPIFNDQWKLIGIHHAGGYAVSRLNGQKGTYEANEGIWIKTIMTALADHLQKNAT